MSVKSTARHTGHTYEKKERQCMYTYEPKSHSYGFDVVYDIHSCRSLLEAAYRLELTSQLRQPAKLYPTSMRAKLWSRSIRCQKFRQICKVKQSFSFMRYNTTQHRRFNTTAVFTVR